MLGPSSSIQTENTLWQMPFQQGGTHENLQSTTRNATGFNVLNEIIRPEIPGEPARVYPEATEVVYSALGRLSKSDG
ncbi:hypothetical protein PILCRDRAFT_661736 [Piloderma croceum F 1598]|uniref:Uncharacterized protein n=1 Tax=Piloderma croceum (strain F 1598) TaxID=765440 RepID=A0A0C3F7T7_PILCF|nr:hypothetical protein PILCRDRAFT_661736 [Piloderma croceum F 1598]